MFAFVDEYGDPNLNTKLEGTTDHFVVSAVMVQPAALAQLETDIEGIRREHFQQGELRSSKVGSDWPRRMRILERFRDLDFRLHLLIIHKARIEAEGGLQFKRSFIKYVHGMLYSRIYRAIPNLQVIADEHGSRAFMDGFEKYVRERHIPSLFDAATIRFDSSRAQPGIQLADFVGGCIGHSLRPDSPYGLSVILRLLYGHTVSVREWPLSPRPMDINVGAGQGDLDDTVRRLSFSLAATYIAEHQYTIDYATQCQVEILRALHFHSEFISDSTYVSTRRLRMIAESLGGKKISEHFFRSQVVASLRDGGVLIASSPKGYKLPVTVADMTRFVEQASLTISPLTARLRTACDVLLTASDGRLNILQGTDFLPAAQVSAGPIT